MKQPLEGARRKLAWAAKHLSALEKEIAQYLESQPFWTPTEHEGNVTRSELPNAQPPLELACILDDCLSNLRTSLDYVAWALAAQYGHPAPLVHKDRFYFPLTKKSADFKPEWASKYRVPRSAIELIESVQPYQAGYELLGVLHSLVNEHKHRLPPLKVACVQATSPEALVDPQRIGGKIDGQRTVFVSLENPLVPLAPVDTMAEQILKCVAGVIPRFDAFLG